jgi:hypothetical protein
MKPLALMYKALTRIIMTSDVIAFQGILKTEIIRSLAGVSEGWQQYELSHNPIKNLLYKAHVLSQWINLQGSDFQVHYVCRVYFLFITVCFMKFFITRNIIYTSITLQCLQIISTLPTLLFYSNTYLPSSFTDHLLQV